MNTNDLRHRFIAILAASAALLGGLASGARAGELAPGSLLIFPEFDPGEGAEYLITVTNLHPTQSITTDWIYVDGERCTEFNRNEPLTPNDTLTVIASIHNPETGAGFMYVTAIDLGLPQSPEISFNWLIGTATRLDGLEAFAYTVDPFTFEAFAPELGLTDADGDGLQDFDGIEYSTTPDEILVPRFLGQGPALQSDLVLLNLSGTVQFEVTVNLLISNDNEEIFTTDHSFRCWEKASLLDISFAFSEEFLDSTNNDPDEVVGAPGTESGWLRIDGLVANSTVTTINDPAILAFLIEGTGGSGQSAELPFGVGSQDNGALLNLSITATPDRKPGGNLPFAPQR